MAKSNNKKSSLKGSRKLGNKKQAKHMSESSSAGSDTDLMMSILNTDINTNHTGMQQMPNMQMPNMQMPNMQMPNMQMPNMQMPNMQMPMMGQQNMNMADVDPLMINTLAPINNQQHQQSFMNQGNLLSGSQMANNLGNLAKLSGNNMMAQNDMMSELSPAMSQMSMGHQMPMMGQMMGQMMPQQMPTMGQMMPGLKNLAALH